MESVIAADAPLDCVTFRILPENKYEACIYIDEKDEMVGDGPLDQLLEHFPFIKDWIANGSCDNFKLELPNSVYHRAWFTKSTLKRFLHVIDSSDLKSSVAISNEMSQLEETRKFHLSLYTQTDGVTASDASKNELLRAMDLRLAALTEELVSTFNLASGGTVLSQEMMDLQEFCQHFGDVYIRNLLSKLSENCKKAQTSGLADKARSPVSFVSKNDHGNKSGGSIQMLGQTNTVKPVKYNASPAKAAEIERQCSTESEDSSFSSEDDQPPVERSRTLVRSASPRRSASPMRKIQIGRSGSRRTPTLAIKSLPYFPPRERLLSQRDGDNDFNSEGEPIKKTEVNVTRMSVQDAISLFERKQKDETVDGQKKSSNDNSMNMNKAVLRRWSSGMGESQKSLSQNTPDNTTLESKIDFEEEDALEHGLITDASNNQESMDAVEADTVADTRENIEANQNVGVGTSFQTDETEDKLDTAEWNRQREEELSQMLMKFAQYSLSTPKNVESNETKKQTSRLHQKVVNHPQTKRRDEKLGGATAVKKVEKQANSTAKKKVVDKPKPEKSSTKGSDVVKKHTTSRISNVNSTSRMQNVNKVTAMSPSSKTESPKPDMLKKAPKSSALPATRKSWPSAPSPRSTAAVPAKSSTGPPSAISTARQKSQIPAPCQKPQSPAPVSRPIPKFEKPQLQQKDVKKSQGGAKKMFQKVDDSKSHMASKGAKTMKTKTAIAPDKDAAASAAKTVVRKKVTKKSTVVPLEAKPSCRKVSGVSPGSNPAVEKTENSTQATEQPLSKCEETINIAENVGALPSNTVQPLEWIQESEAVNGHLKLETKLEKEEPDNEDGQELPVGVCDQDDEPAERLSESPAEAQLEQEAVISPAAWEESSQPDPAIPTGNGSSPSPVKTDVVAPSGPRVRHSLSQMLLEESSEPDMTEWGNAENPPAMIYQKDAPKGLKRLLKFARKNKGETNGTAWASPYTSEGEDDGDEFRSLGKRHSDNLLKVALHSKNYGEGFLSDSEPQSARSNASNSSARSSNKFQEGHASSKGARSFFSLSAFRGNRN